MTRTLLALLALAALNAAQAETPKPRLIDFNPWAWLPANRNRSPSIMDYFFPPSRTPKQSTLDPPPDRVLPKLTTTNQTPPPTTAEERATTLARKVSNKTKSTAPATYPTATSPPKTKKTSHKTNPPTTTIEPKTLPPKTEIPTKTDKIETSTKPATVKVESSTKTVTVPTTYRPTKHYTIRPVVRTTETPTAEDTETSSISESTETVDTSATTAEDVKETTGTLSTASDPRSTDAGTASTTAVESTTQTDTTAEPADSREGYLPLRDKPQQTHVKINDQTKKETVPLPGGATSVLAKPTKYHYYPHNQHIYLLPECAIQQVCNAVYVRLNYTQPLCACPARYRDPCSASLNADDLHTTRLTTDSKKKTLCKGKLLVSAGHVRDAEELRTKQGQSSIFQARIIRQTSVTLTPYKMLLEYANKAVTLVKTCEAVSEMRECRAPRDWSLLALQNIRTGKSHYLVICRCPENHILEGPMSHDQPTYASVPGIRVYGMMCVKPTTYPGYSANRFTAAVQSTTSAYKVDYSQAHAYGEKPMYNRYQTHSYLDSNYYNRRSRVARFRRSTTEYPPFPWHKVKELAKSLHWIY